MFCCKIVQENVVSYWCGFLWAHLGIVLVGILCRKIVEKYVVSFWCESLQTHLEIVLVSTFGRNILQKHVVSYWCGSLWAFLGSVCIFLHMAPEVDRMSSRWSDLTFSGLGSRNRQNEFQENRFNKFMALAPEVDKMSSRTSDLSIFWSWLQKSTK